jgi:hypothetical protein
MNDTLFTILVCTLLGALGGLAGSWLASIVSRREKECDHVFFHAEDHQGKLIGQECILCGKFNPIEEVIKDEA